MFSVVFQYLGQESAEKDSKVSRVNAYSTLPGSYFLCVDHKISGKALLDLDVRLLESVAGIEESDTRDELLKAINDIRPEGE